MSDKRLPPITGLRPILEALKLEDYPTDKRNLYYSVGDFEVTDTHGRRLAVRDLLDRVERKEFASAEDAVQAIREVIQQRDREERAA